MQKIKRSTLGLETEHLSKGLLSAGGDNSCSSRGSRGWRVPCRGWVITAHILKAALFHSHTHTQVRAHMHRETEWIHISCYFFVIFGHFLCYFLGADSCPITKGLEVWIPLHLSLSLCPWARHETHNSSYECKWMLVVGGPFGAGWLLRFYQSALEQLWLNM